MSEIDLADSRLSVLRQILAREDGLDHRRTSRPSSYAVVPETRMERFERRMDEDRARQLEIQRPRFPVILPGEGEREKPCRSRAVGDSAPEFHGDV